MDSGQDRMMKPTLYYGLQVLKPEETSKNYRRTGMYCWSYHQERQFESKI